MAERTSGIALSEEFFRTGVQPLLDRGRPDLPYAAALLGRGSEVLGFDDAMSTDHDWTARVTVLLDPDAADQVDGVRSMITEAVPSALGEVPTAVEVATLDGYVRAQLALEIDEDWDAFDWLSLPTLRLAALTGGVVHHDEIGLREVRDRLAWYPRDVWLYLLAAGWWRVHPELNLVGRSGWAGDELGSAVMAGGIVADLMHLAFLIERRHAPYRKWFGTAFSRLEIAGSLGPHLDRAVAATAWTERQEALGEAYTVVAAAFDRLQLVDPLPLETVRMWDRPFTVPWADYPSLLTAEITDPAVRSLMAQWPPLSGVDRVRDLLWAPQHRAAIRALCAHGTA
ncbi:hypothetical protein FHX74_002376 [Friedmanniella endophytica]|uniref:DUF4037 domain-containing protein n=1 Tax=Microlunatus kandeliicorticis TaxID=1759536 RepID=A0A7W3P6A7_9ACTN|nr:DUF4037 domain-containing protein [Microlunatus kandeliicorticis]MBA8794757.1 hypothetical protein [Microlunatus kandeliicorticis]